MGNLLRKYYVFTLVLVLMLPINSSVFSAAEEYNMILLFEQIFDKVKHDYVEDVKDKELIENALNGMLSSLDPHSGYLDEKAFEDMRMQTKGEFGGLGLEVTLSNGLVKVISPIDDTPAFKAGVKSGDLIISIDDEMVMGMSLYDAVGKMRGKPGVKIRLTVLRGEESEPIEFEINRSIIKVNPVRSVDYDEIGYFRVNSFSENTTENLKKEIAKFRSRKDKKLKAAILDLRNNPGGLLDQAIGVTDLFLTSGQIVSTKGRIPESISSFNASQSKDDLTDIPILVLINGGSASASEIVAGALQDHKRAIIVGTKSFGKGSVQNVIPLPNKGAMRLTTARYYTPSGKSIQAEGIVPDIIVEAAKIEFLDSKKRNLYSEANLKGHLNKGDKEAEKPAEPVDGEKNPTLKQLKSKIPVKDDAAAPKSSAEAEIYAQDYQLARALDLLRGILVVKNIEQKK